MTLKIGVFLPGSNFITGLAKGMFHSFKTGLKEKGIENVEFVTESAGYHVDYKLLQDKISKLIVVEDVDLVIMPLNPGMLQHLKEPFMSNEVPLIMLNLGEDPLFHEDNFDYLFVNNFNEWQSNWMLGNWAGNKIGKKSSNFTSLHEAGYRLSYAYALGLEAAGGAIVNTQITHRETRTENPKANMENTLDDGGDIYAGFYSSKEGISFLNAFQEENYKDKRGLIGNSFMVSHDVLKQTGEAALDVHSVTTWDYTNDSSENKNFVNNFKEKFDRFPDAYSLLAYESAGLIANSLDNTEKKTARGAKLKDLLNKAQINGPRGTISWTNKDEVVKMKSYLMKVDKNEKGEVANQMVEELQIPELYYEQVKLAEEKLDKQGWFNPYLVG